MTKRALLTAFFGLVLVLGLTTSSMASPFWGTSDNFMDAYHTVDPSLKTTWYNSGDTPSTPQVLAPLGDTSPLIHGTYNVLLSSGWTTSDVITVALYSTTAGFLTSISSSGYDTANSVSYHTLYFDLYGQYDSGAKYYMIAESSTGATEQWRLTSDSFSFATNGVNSVTGKDETTPTPLPAAVWMLGSGLLGITGFKRFRKNSSAS